MRDGVRRLGRAGAGDVNREAEDREQRHGGDEATHVVLLRAVAAESVTRGRPADAVIQNTRNCFGR